MTDCLVIAGGALSMIVLSALAVRGLEALLRLHWDSVRRDADEIDQEEPW